MYTILGAGLSGISVADHLEKAGISYQIFEGKAHGGGHIFSENVDGFIWDEGPHVSFTQHEYVKKYFEENCGQAFLEYPTSPANFYKNNWIPHPAQTNMYAIPEPLRSECLIDLASIRIPTASETVQKNYREWLEYAFGKTFAETFPVVYTKKYWTTGPENLDIDWIGKRVYFPEASEMAESAKGPLNKKTHYVGKVRYPANGGYYSYIKSVEKRLKVQYNKRLSQIWFNSRKLLFEDGQTVIYDKLINTLPLPLLIANSDAPFKIKRAAEKLKCSKLLLLNFVVNHPAVISNQWVYVYDESFYSTRISFTELFAPSNGETGKCGIQVEVYFSAYRPLAEPIDVIENKVLNELVKMQLINAVTDVKSSHTKWIEWANVIFDHERVEAQNEIFSWLETVGMTRETDDLAPMTDWLEKVKQHNGDVIMAGRFAQWKYYWTDDCVMRAKNIIENINYTLV